MQDDQPVQDEDARLDESGRNPAAFAVSLLALAIAVISAVVTGLEVLTVADMSLFVFLVALWDISPYVVLAILSLVCSRWLAAAYAVLAGCILICVPSLYILYDAVHVHPDPQSPILFLFLPGWQFMAMVVIIPIARTIARRFIDTSP